MIMEPILQNFDPEQPVTTEIDVSDHAIGAICSQPDAKGMLHPVASYSRKLKDLECNYDIHDKKLLAIVDALRKWNTYCKTTGTKITILTDHKNLEYWKTKKDLNLRQAWWGEQLANYDFMIKYRPGKLAGKPDILSRESGDSLWEGDMKHRQNYRQILLPEEAFKALQANITETINLEIDKELLNEIRTLSAADKEIQEIRRKKASGTTRDGEIALGLCEENSGLLMYDSLIWIPDNDTLRLRILRDHHDAQAVGHPGRARTLELVSRNFYWPGQRKYIHRYVDYCDTCHRIKQIHHAQFGLLKPLELPHRPWDMISMDFITALPTSNGKHALWVIIDCLTKMGHFVACQGTMDAEDLADHFLQQVIRPNRVPSSIVSDRGSLFTSDFWKRVTEALGISCNLSTAFHPQTDGQTERANATLEQYLRAYCNYQQDDWERLLPNADFCYNNTQTGTTKITPYFANYGYHPRFLPDLGTWKEETPEVSEYVAALRRLHEEIRAEIKNAQMSQTEQANKARHPDQVLNPGDRVWLQRKHI